MFFKTAELLPIAKTTDDKKSMKKIKNGSHEPDVHIIIRLVSSVVYIV